MRWWARFSIGRTAFWLTVIVPAIFLGWVYSVAFVSACSIYANAASDFAAWRADKNDDILKRLNKLDAKLDQLLKEARIDN